MGLQTSAVRRAVVVCALGYFIDIFDIQLFTVLRGASLKELGVTPDRLAAISGYILNAQMLGMIGGAFLWGWFGDRHGRLKALFGSILVYSLGTLACGFVNDPVSYGICRFIAGIGLAGETGLAITLVAELMTPLKRGWGITIIAGFGNLGPVAAILLSQFLDWRATYVTVGLFGFLLLFLRMKLMEPELFRKTAAHENARGSLKLLAQPRQAFIFLCCALIMLPLTYAWWLLNFFSAELGHAVLPAGEGFDHKTCLMLFYLGTSAGDFAGGTISQLWHSRRKPIAAFFFAGLTTALVYLLVGPHIGMTAGTLYVTYFVLGIAGGCLVLVSMIASEHFGTNIRATTATITTNLRRFFSIPMVFAFQGLQAFMSITHAAALIGVVFYAIAFLALYRLRETHGLDLDYVEKMGDA